MGSKRSVIRRIELLPDGGEKELEKSVEESAKEDEEPSKVRRVVHRFKTGPTGEKVPEDPEHVSPLECSTTEESDSEVDVKRVKGKELRTISRRSISTSQKKIIRRVVESKEGVSDSPIEDTIEEPVETSKYSIVRKTIIGSDGKTSVVEEPHFELPEDAKVSVGEEKDEKGVVVRRIIRRPVPVITRRRVYRKVVLAPDGTEKGVEEKVLEPTEIDEQLAVEPTIPVDIHLEEPRDEVITKREVHRTVVVPTETKESVDVIPSETEEEHSSDEAHQGRKVITVRRKIVRRIIVLPDGTRKEVEEEVPTEEIDSDYDIIDKDQVHSTIIPVELDTLVGHPKPVERVHVTRVIRKPDGVEDIIDQSDSVFPLEDESKESVEEQEKDRHGVVIRWIVRRPVIVTSK